MKKVTKELTKKISLDETKALVSKLTKNVRLDALKELAEKQLPYYLANPKVEFDEKTKLNIKAASLVMSLETGCLLESTISEKYRPLILHLKDEFEKEYNVKTASEKAMADLAANAYVRNLVYSKRLNVNQEFEFFGSKRNGYLNFLSIEIDRTLRQFRSAIEYLDQRKQPDLKINIKAKNAFIADKQQINNQN